MGLIRGDELGDGYIGTESEVIKKVLRKLLKDHAALVIAHRNSTLQSANLIVALRNGQILEQGTHDQIVANERLSYRLLSYNDTAEETQSSRSQD